MNRSTVALVQCTTYDLDAVEAALRRGIALLGGLEQFVKPGERILLKPNVLAGDAPERAVTTHPVVLEASARIFQAGGATISFGDSPGFENPVHAARSSGMTAAGARCGATLADFATARSMSAPVGEGRRGLRFPIAQAVHDCDGLINLPKMKTHQLTRITGAVKNLFGCVVGARKALYHVQHQDVQDFAELLVELALALPCRLHILDGIVAMEGNGPRSGDPREVGVLLLSTDPVAVDATFCRIVDMDPGLAPTNPAGQRLGLGVYDEAQIDLVGDDLDALRVPSFRMVRKPVYDNASYAHYRPIKNALLPKPVIDAFKCVRCGVCVDACPVPGKALRFTGSRKESPPVYDYDVCIRCYCCQEMCPHGAIDTVTPLLGRLLGFG
ncbi:MAG: DUF362 domain-containing protein [Anaerolineae bacterium]|nr:DUF362 domain-containing protein [Anaerolineae bacterium]